MANIENCFFLLLLVPDICLISLRVQKLLRGLGWVEGNSFPPVTSALLFASLSCTIFKSVARHRKNAKNITKGINQCTDNVVQIYCALLYACMAVPQGGEAYENIFEDATAFSSPERTLRVCLTNNIVSHWEQF